LGLSDHHFSRPFPYDGGAQQDSLKTVPVERISYPSGTGKYTACSGSANYCAVYRDGLVVQLYPACYLAGRESGSNVADL
jgi:hypothetical protein